jgi:hypothetical protein
MPSTTRNDRSLTPLLLILIIVLLVVPRRFFFSAGETSEREGSEKKEEAGEPVREDQRTQRGKNVMCTCKRWDSLDMLHAVWGQRLCLKGDYLLTYSGERRKKSEDTKR